MNLKKLLMNLACGAFACGACAADTGNTQTALDFENASVWTTAPPELSRQMKKYGASESDLWCNQAKRDRHWVLEPVALKTFSGGLKLSKKHVKSGAYSGRWSDLTTYPTVASHDVPHDWSGHDTFSMWVYSERPTGNTVYLGILSDNPKTRNKDFFFHPVKLDWNGWKQLVVPFGNFTRWQQPQGWNQVDGIYFFARAFGNQPNPYNVLWLDDIRLLKQGKIAPSSSTNPDVFVYKNRYKDEPLPLNHNFPESVVKGPVVTQHKFITHQPYFRAEQALYKYYPRFSPGYPSFDPSGNAYIYSGNRIQWLAANGKWTYCNLKPVLMKWAEKQGWKGFYNVWGAQGGDTAIRFDNAGGMYVLVQAEELNAAGKQFDWKTRCTLLLYSKDRTKNWQIYKLPGRIASFEKLDGNNLDCLKRPPVILLGDYKYFSQADKNGYMLLPEHTKDGRLDLSHLVKYAENCIVVNYHSGDANVALTVGDKVYIAYGWCPEASAYPAVVRKLEKKLGQKKHEVWKLSNLRKTKLAKSLPEIPEGHPGMNMKSRYRIHIDRTSVYPEAVSGDGVPTFIVAYDLKKRKLGKPVYIGSGGGAIDAHNWPAITVDSNGIIHALINGHHNPAVYTKMIKPGDITQWTKPELVIPGGETPLLSYATLNCDRNNTLYSVHRASNGTYNNRLALFRKRYGQPWEEERTLVAPFKPLYYVWYQKMICNPYNNRLYLSYFSHSRQSYMSEDMYEFLIFQRPEQEPQLNVNHGRKNASNPGQLPLQKDPFWDSWTYGAMYNPDASGVVTLVSGDSGEEWSLAVTRSYDKPAGK